MDRPTYLWKKSSTGQRYPCWPVWYREPYPIKKHFRVLDCEDEYDSDDFYRVEFRIASDPAYTEYVSPHAKQRLAYQKKARARAEAIVREIEQYKRNAVWRKRLTRAKNEFDFVFEPYRQALKKKYGWQWRWEVQKKLQDIYDKVWHTMRVLAARRVYELAPKYSVSDWAVRKANGQFAYGLHERFADEVKIKQTIVWVRAFNNPFFTKIVCKLIDEQKDIRDQVDICDRLKTASDNGRLQAYLEQLQAMRGAFDNWVPNYREQAR